ncbi:putative aldouronate transport system permease protein [Paenibacillus rhizosphaerae]|uniref:Putative aldouronate transport system permease protein n=2 Tax=Paenibacillus rhizosphaerae TaxID=297318 RepID=A0A839TIJ5_9BACL|nr:putative aldouronate transport system permease protein [Paenibacillus rhizosphaerae]
MPEQAPAAVSAARPALPAPKRGMSNLRKYKALYLISLPGIIYFIVFKYLPLLGSVMAFQNYNIFKGFTGSPWVGFDQFRRMFTYPEFLRILENTVLIGFYDLIFAFPVPIIFALLLNELRKVVYKRILQTVVYLPHFLSWVIIGGIMIGILSPTTGIVNQVLNAFGLKSIYFLGEDSYIRSILVGTGIWKDSGWGTIVYLAALASVNPELYEAARIDGASRWRQTLSITIPAILPTITIMFLLHIGNFLDFGFERVFVFVNSLNESKGDILDTYIYRVGLIDQQYSYTTAIGLFKSVVGLVLVMIGNTLSKRASGEGLY